MPTLRTPTRAVTAALGAVERAENAVFGELRDEPAPYLARKRIVWPLEETTTGIDHRRLPDPLIRQLPEPFAQTMSTSTSSVASLQARGNTRRDQRSSRIFSAGVAAMPWTTRDSTMVNETVAQSSDASSNDSLRSAYAM